MRVQALGYVGFGASDLADWSEFATKWLGMQMVERGNAVRAFRMDNRKQRLIVDRALPEGQRYFGWEVADAAALDELAAKLDSACISLQREPTSLADARFVTGLISFADPAGNRLEAFHGPQIADSGQLPEGLRRLSMGGCDAGARLSPVHQSFARRSISDDRAPPWRSRSQRQNHSGG